MNDRTSTMDENPPLKHRPFDFPEREPPVGTVPLKHEPFDFPESEPPLKKDE